MSTKVTRALRALHELGLHQTLSYAQYKISLRSGLLARQVRRAIRLAAEQTGPQVQLKSGLLPLPDPAFLRQSLQTSAFQQTFAEAGEICSGNLVLFGGPLNTPLNFSQTEPWLDWSAYEGQTWLPGGTDIKFIWEPARFGWAVTLARAEHLAPNPLYAAVFWQQAEAFFAANPPGLGPHWASAQEVALRLICLVFAWQVFEGSPQSTPARAALLAAQIAQHAARIPASLSYARAQNNNHLLSEAAALYTAGLALPAHPQAGHWRTLGWNWFHAGLSQQIEPDGSYSQHSSNYHRLMLQLALWVKTLAERPFPAESSRLAGCATRWLANLLDPTSGRLPNLGPNDGAYILPLSSLPFADYRPVLQAAGRAFLHTNLFPPGSWDEMSLWHGLAAPAGEPLACTSDRASGVLRSPSGRSWGYLRAVQFKSRPGHADQLHVDLWWQGLNVALDPGTYLYNAPPPWDNALVCAQVHNTITLDGQDQMQRAGRFLYLQPAQAEYTEHLTSPDQSWERLTARHTGYRRLGALHVRSLARVGETWQIEDQLLPAAQSNPAVRLARLHWLVPDWHWELASQEDGGSLFLESPRGRIEVRLSASADAQPVSASLLLGREGKILAGAGRVGEDLPSPTWGWRSPTYGVRQPALSIALTVSAALPVTFTTLWIFPGN